MTPSMALPAVWLVLVFCEDAVAVAVSARSTRVPAMVMVTVSGVLVLPLLSVTTSWKVRVALLAGAVKVGLTAVALERVTAVPAVWVHW